MKDRYCFPAVFDYASDGISVLFPDLPGCLTCGTTTEEALHCAHEALEGFIYLMEQDGDIIPSPSDPLAVKDMLESNQAMTLIEVYMPIVRDAMSNKSVNKMVTLPQWLITAGKKSDINFSQTLQEAVILKLGLSRRSTNHIKKH